MAASRSSRRDFFRQVVDRGLSQAADLLGQGRGADRPRTRLRPPGALPEAQFLATCYHCGNCVDACPAHAIAHVQGDGEPLNGTPVIVASAQPCLVCDSLACMQVCPSGALRPTPREQIRMGRAAVDHGACLRTQGQDCRVCVDLCPMGEAALRLDDAGAVAVGPGCIGCGICEWQCPTDPRAVVVQAR